MAKISACLRQRSLEILLVITCILLCCGTQDERECHYWYRRFPATPSAVCYGTNQTTTVNLLCEVEYRVLNSSDSIVVRWYRSRDEKTAGIEGEILKNVINKYQQFSSQRQVNQTFIRQYGLGILRFNSSDRGYYWCQMVVNNVSLSPSPYGHINGSQCTALDAICDIDQPICAQNTRTQYIYNMLANISYNCILQKFVTSTSRTASRNIASTLVYDTSQSTNKRALATVTMSPTVSRKGVNCDQSRSHICAAGIASGLVVLILSSLMVMVLCFFFLRKKRRHQGNVNLDTKDVQYDNIEMEEAQNEEISEPYYSEITHNNNSDSGYMMKPNTSYSTSQIAGTTIDISGNGQSLARVCTSCKSSVEAFGKNSKT